MGVYIKGMKMPSKCIECKLMRRCGKDDLDYVCMPARVYVEDLTNAYKLRPEYCPLIELPEEHGDLIDRDKLRKKKWTITWDDGKAEYYNAEDIEAAPAVIPAEGRTE